jgi:hypothetical protein
MYEYRTIRKAPALPTTPYLALDVWAVWWFADKSAR